MARERLTFRRLVGLDRSGPPPPATLAGMPLHVWTLPNAIGFGRLALIPVFLGVGLTGDTGRDATAALLFAVIGWSDYLDGMTARITGQYSRFGALLDPVVDRLLVVSGLIVCWDFELLPRVGLALLAAREVFMLGASQAWLRRNLEIRINWFGRLGVLPTMGAPFFAMVGLLDVGEACLWVGLAMALTATVFYLRDGLAQLAARRAAGPSSST